MKRFTLAALVCAAAINVTAQTPANVTAQAPAPPKAEDKVVAVINGEVITQSRLEHMWKRLTPAMREAYARSGGKGALLENYIAKRLLLQEALKRNFIQRPDVQLDMELARESALFDRYIKDEVASTVITESNLIDYYDSHKGEFSQPEAVKVRHIIIMPGGKQSPTREDAAAKLLKIAAGLEEARKAATGETAAAAAVRNRFAEQARLYSEDGSAKDGGDLGWVSRGAMDDKFEQAAFALPAGAVSPIVESRYGLHLIFVEDHRTGGLQPFDSVKPLVREAVLAQKQAEVMGTVQRLTNELRRTAAVTIMRENIQ